MPGGDRKGLVKKILRLKEQQEAKKKAARSAAGERTKHEDGFASKPLLVRSRRMEEDNGEEMEENIMSYIANHDRA
jgi:hypothetical protein